MHRGIPVTTATRTIFDVASTLRPKALREAFEQAEYLELLDRSRLITLLDGAKGRRGLGELRALAGADAIPLSQTRSRLERLVLSICRTHDLPIPGVNVPLLGYEVDFHWPQARFVVEADGGHHVGERRDRDNARDVALARAGQLVRRYSGEALRDEQVVAMEILEILRERLPGAELGSIASRIRD
jgi:very-short-patch-repair endonuclease